ncbi:DNA alkylation repair protein [Alphaproteobacteria bacterium KMM 3653]|uniref:DNA alkylation repair protein n=1 Tax=Harenicola maris TaxID=2841044 RepID=A0AAP2CMI3_9RHOB|nr:DNA alkylation repair protein [Harenicola maris]
MTPEAAIEAISAKSKPGKAEEMAKYHKAERPYLGVANPDIYVLTKEWRAALTLDDRLALASGLWDSNIHEARTAAANLLLQARIRPDDTAAWELIKSWVPDFDGWALADHACGAGAKRLIADPARLDEVEQWTKSEHMWSRRAALVSTLPWTKQNNPKAADLEIRDRVLGWAAGYVSDPDWFIQKAIAWWLRELSKHDAPRVHDFLGKYGSKLKPFVRREAARLMPDGLPPKAEPPEQTDQPPE